MKAQKLRRRVLGTAGLLVGALIGCFYLVQRHEAQTEAQERWVLHTHDVLGELAAARLTTLESYQRCAFPAAVKVQASGECDASVEQLAAELAQLRRLTLDNPEQQRLLDQLVRDEGAWVASLRLLTGGETNGGKGSASAPASQPGSQQGSQAAPKQVLEVLGQMDRNERILLKQRTGRVRQNASRLRILLLAASALATLMVLLSAYTTQRELLLRAKVESGLRHAHELLGSRYQERAAELDHALADLHEQILERQRAEREVLRVNERLEDRVRNRTAELQEINQELEAFTYSVSHDLRAPLRHLNGFARILQDSLGENASEEARGAMMRIRQAAARMAELLEDLLALSKVGRQLPQLVSVSLTTLVESVREEVAADASTREIEWRIDNLPNVQADPNLLRVVLTNLLSNAVKFTRERELARIHVGSREEGREAVVYVEDNGAGFDPAYADKLFGVFQRLHRQEEFEGTGIGLATSQRIIRKHGGRIWAQAKPNEGATFYFSLPLPSSAVERIQERLGATA